MGDREGEGIHGTRKHPGSETWGPHPLHRVSIGDHCGHDHMMYIMHDTRMHVAMIYIMHVCTYRHQRSPLNTIANSAAYLLYKDSFFQFQIILKDEICASDETPMLVGFEALQIFQARHQDFVRILCRF